VNSSSTPLPSGGARLRSRLTPISAAFVPCAVAAALAFALLTGQHALAQSSIKILVNDEAITSFDIKQRTQMLRVFTRNQQGEAEATEQLIDERLMVQEAKRRGVSITDGEIDQEIAKRARSAKLSSTQFQQAMRQAGFDPATFRDFIRANVMWQQIVRARFRAEGQVTDQDVTAALTERPAADPTADTTAEEDAAPTVVYEYRLQPIIFVVPAGAAPAVETQRRNEAAAFRRDFAGCDAALQQIGGTPGVVVKPAIRREESQMNPALKQALAGLDIGGITEPERVGEGIQLLGVCAKQEIAGQTTATVEVREELSNERGQLLARRYLRDLRSDAVIEYR
jgi:peptidyl-prolyl cis-trans isomerase SurA